MNELQDTMILVEDYETLVGEVGAPIGDEWSQSQLDRLKGALIVDGDWTPEAADHLVELATNYGSFMLRDAYALALAMKIEDGALGF